MTKTFIYQRVRDQRLAEIRSRYYQPRPRVAKKVDPVPTRPEMASMVSVVREYLDNQAVSLTTLSIWSGISEGDIEAELVRRGIEDQK